MFSLSDFLGNGYSEFSAFSVGAFDFDYAIHDIYYVADEVQAKSCAHYVTCFEDISAFKGFKDFAEFFGFHAYACIFYGEYEFYVAVMSLACNTQGYAACLGVLCGVVEQVSQDLL